MKAKKILAFALSVMAAGAVAIGVSGYKGMTVYAADTQTAVEQQTIEGELTVGEQTNGSMTLKWSRIDAAKGYTVSLSDSSGNVIVKQSLGVKELSVKFDGLDGNVTYLARLEVLTSDDELITVKETEVYQPLAQPAFSLSAATDRVTVSWKRYTALMSMRYSHMTRVRRSIFRWLQHRGAVSHIPLEILTPALIIITR